MVAAKPSLTSTGEAMIMRLRTVLHRTASDTGASAVEYGLIVVAIAALIAAVVFALGTIVQNTYSESCGTINGEITNGASTSC